MKNPAKSALAALAVLSLCAFGTSAAERYAVSAELTHQGTAFATPSMVVRAGEPATLQVSGPDGFTLALTVKESAPGKLTVSAAVDSVHGAMQPVVVVAPGVPASVTVGDLGLALTVNPGDG